MSDQTPLALTDDQLDQIVRCAAPLHPELRRVFVEHVAYALRGKTISDGTVYLACRQVLRESGMFFRPTSGSAPVTGNMTDLGAARGRLMREVPPQLAQRRVELPPGGPAGSPLPKRAPAHA